jgi:transcriptional regulator with XRE-family HTH domain
MSKPLNPAVIGALVRERREAAGLTQTQLAERIGASRFWVAAFERGKPSAELGLALKAVQALGLAIRIERSPALSAGTKKEGSASPNSKRAEPLEADSTLAKVIAHATLTHAAPSKVVGWPGAEAPRPPKRPHA